MYLLLWLRMQCSMLNRIASCMAEASNPIASMIVVNHNWHACGVYRIYPISPDSGSHTLTQPCTTSHRFPHITQDLSNSRHDASVDMKIFLQSLGTRTSVTSATTFMAISTMQHVSMDRTYQTHHIDVKGMFHQWMCSCWSCVGQVTITASR